MSTGPVESKVKGATLGAAAAGLCVWLLENYLFKGVVPVPVQAFIDVAIPAGLALLLGWSAPHTWRHDPDATRRRPPV